MTRLTRVGLLSLLLIVLLTSCGEPAYIPDADTLAARDVAEYDRSVKKDWVLFGLACAVIIIGGSILLYLLWQIRGVTYRNQSAKAARLEALAWKEGLVSIGNGQILAQDGTLYSADIDNVAPPPRITYQPPEVTQRDDNPLVAFITDAATIAGWHSLTFPHWRKWLEKGYQMTAEEWKQKTDVLVGAGYLNHKQQGKITTVAYGKDLLWISNSITPHPAGEYGGEQLSEQSEQ